MARNPSGDDPTSTAPYQDMDGDIHWNGSTVYVEGAVLDFGADAEGAAIKTIVNSGTIAVTVPSITDPDIAQVAVDTSALTFAAAVGDQVLVTPVEALPTNCRLQGAYVSAANEVTICFGSEGGNVTGAAKNFNFLFFDVTGITYKPGWTFKVGGPGDRFLCVFATTPDSANPARQRTTQHMFEMPAGLDERAFCRWVFDRLLDCERHEAGEFFAVDGFRPFFPNHQHEGSPYELVERWT